MSLRPITPVADDAHAAAPQPVARAAADYANTQAADRKHAEHGGTEVREGVLPGGGTR